MILVIARSVSHTIMLFMMKYKIMFIVFKCAMKSIPKYCIFFFLDIFCLHTFYSSVVLVQNKIENQSIKLRHKIVSFYLSRK